MVSRGAAIHVPSPISIIPRIAGDDTIRIKRRGRVVLKRDPMRGEPSNGRFRAGPALRQLYEEGVGERGWEKRELPVEDTEGPGCRRGFRRAVLRGLRRAEIKSHRGKELICLSPSNPPRSQSHLFPPPLPTRTSAK